MNLKQRLVAANLNLSDIELRSPRELRVSVPRESITGVRRLPAGRSPCSSGTDRR